MEQIDKTLSSLINTVPDSAVAALLGLDGVGVQVAFSDSWKESDPAIIEIELAAVADAVQRAAKGIAGETSPEFFVGTAQANFVGMMVDSAYFLILGLEPMGDLSLAKDALEQARAALV